MEAYNPIRLPYSELDGISAELLEDHYQLYLSYIKRIKGVREKLGNALEKPGIW